MGVLPPGVLRPPEAYAGLAMLRALVLFAKDTPAKSVRKISELLNLSDIQRCIKDMYL